MFGGQYRPKGLFDELGGRMLSQRTQTSLRRLKDVLKRSRRLQKNVAFTTPSRRLSYVVLKTSNFGRLEEV